MEYGKLKPSESARFSEQLTKARTQNHNIIRKHGLRAIQILVCLLVIAALSTTTVVLVVKHKHHESSSPGGSPSSSLTSPPPTSSQTNASDLTNAPTMSPDTSLSMLTRMCRMTQFPDMCSTTLGEYMQGPQVEGLYEAIQYGDDQLTIVQVSLNVTADRLGGALDHFVLERSRLDPVKHSLQWAAHDDCVELMEDSMDLLTRARPHLRLLSAPSSTTASEDKDAQRISTLDMMTWMTTLCTNQDTCKEGFEEAKLVNGAEKAQTVQMIQDLTQIVSNHIVLSSLVVNNNHNGRRLMDPESRTADHGNLSYPKWLSREKRELMYTYTPLGDIQPNITVSQNGTGPNVTVTTIGKAIALAPKNSSTPFIVHITAGIYREVNLTVGKNKNNIWFIGDGKGKTVITGNLSYIANNITTMKTASFGATGNGFFARGITFENTAGPENHQAVALYVKSADSVFYDCEMKGYQDTLYVHSNRQFYRECYVYGTVDFIFGNAQAVFQNCSIYARKPMENQNNTITAQKRSCPCTCSGISMHECQILADPDLEPVKLNSTYLGRPWRELATVVYMLSHIGDHVHPQGWLPWNDTSPLDKVFYGEFMNDGPGANISQRIQSPGIHPNLTEDEAIKFTVDQFVGGASWITPTTVPFEPGLGKLDQPPS